MFCKYCGNEINRTTMTCVSCGKPVGKLEGGNSFMEFIAQQEAKINGAGANQSSEEFSSNMRPPVMEDAPKPQATTYNQNNNLPKKEKNNSLTVIIGIITIVALLISVFSLLQAISLKQELADSQQVIAELKQAVADNSTAIADNSTAIADNSTAIADNSAAIADNSTAITDNSAAIEDNSTAISDINTKIDQITEAIGDESSLKAELINKQPLNPLKK